MFKNLVFFLIDFIWNLRCKYKYWLYGAYGLTRVVESMPLKFVIKYLRKYGAQIGDNCIIDSGFKIHRPDSKIPFKNLVIGNYVYLGHNLLLDLTDKIIFEDNTALGANCQIWTHVGDYKYLLRGKDDYVEKVGSVILKQGFVAYSGVIINPGLMLGQYSRVLALSMISHNIPNWEIWGGVPASIIKKRHID